MKSLSVNSQVNITQLGEVARSCLAPGQRGRVLAVFSKAIYLLIASDELFWITAEDTPMHRRCAQISSHLPGPSTGAPFRVEDHQLIVDPGFIFDIDNASTWNAPPLNYFLDFISLPERVYALFSSLNVSQARGFGNFIPHILSLSQNGSAILSPTSTDRILLVAYPLVLGVARACINCYFSQISRIAEKLIGLGTGFTPSGDDFLGGMLFAMKTLRDAYPAQCIDYTIPIESFRSRTHLISFTLLNDLANGHAVVLVHRIINGLISGESLESIHPFISRLTQVGHSTGWDLLSGLLTGLLITHRNDYFIPFFQMSHIMEA